MVYVFVGLAAVVYVFVGLAAVVYVIVDLAAAALVPRLLEGMHLCDRAHPRLARTSEEARGAHPAQRDSPIGVRLAA